MYVSVCVCMYGFMEEKERSIEKERQNGRQKVYAHPMLTQSACALTLRVAWDRKLWMCVSPRKRGGCFFPLLFLPPSLLLVSPTVYPTPLFSIFTCSSRCESSEILNYRNALVSAKTTQLEALLWPDTHFLTLSLSQFWPPTSHPHPNTQGCWQENSAATLAPHCLIVFLSGLNVT